MSEKNRFINHRENLFTLSRPTRDDPTLVVCPKCRHMARVLLADAQPEIGYCARVVCPSCGFTRERTTNQTGFDALNAAPADSFFDYTLWMRTPCCGHTLWAVNRRHLEFLEGFVKAEIRENPKDDLGYSNASMASRLPKWIQSGKNRGRILEGLEKLKQLGGFQSK